MVVLTIMINSQKNFICNRPFYLAFLIVTFNVELDVLDKVITCSIV